MRLQLAGLAIGLSMALLGSLGAGSAWADPEVLLKCEGKVPEGTRFTVAGGWQPFTNPDRAVTITRDKGKLHVNLDGERAYSTVVVFAIPQTGIKTFKVLGQNGIERFQVFENPNTGKPQLRHTISAGTDGSHVYNIRVTTLESCPVISPDVAVSKLATLDEDAKR